MRGIHWTRQTFRPDLSYCIGNTTFLNGLVRARFHLSSATDNVLFNLSTNRSSSCIELEIAALLPRNELGSDHGQLEIQVLYLSGDQGRFAKLAKVDMICCFAEHTVESLLSLNQFDLA